MDKKEALELVESFDDNEIKKFQRIYGKIEILQ